jgi:hypothetical protein
VGLLQPLALLWLLLVVIAIALLYLLRLRRRVVVVSSVLLWAQLLREPRANAPLRKLHRHRLLVLQLLTAVAAGFALSRPFLTERALGGRTVVLVLDGSASMQSRDEGGTRFEAARRAALRMVDAMRPGDRLMPMLATSAPTRLAPLTGERTALRRALRAARPADTATHLREAINLAAGVARAAADPEGSRGGLVYVFSDGAVDDLERIDLTGVELRFVPFGQRAENAGIVAFAVGRSPGRPECQAFLAVRNYSSRPRVASIEFYRDDELFDVRPLALPAAGPGRRSAEQVMVLDGIAAGSAILRARLDGEDDLSSDDEAYASLAPASSRRVLLVSSGNPILEKALSLDPNTRLAVVPPRSYLARPGYDLVVFDGFTPRDVGPGNFLYLDAGGPTCPVDPAGPGGAITLIDWSRPHPITRYVNLRGVRVRKTQGARLRPWGQELVAGNEGPLLAIGEHKRVVDGQPLPFRSLYVGFSLSNTDFWRRVGFPVFITNALDWLAARPDDATAGPARTGEPALLTVPPGVRTVELIDPRGERRQLAVDGPVLLYPSTDIAGVYRAEGAPGFRSRFAASLLSRAESDTHPRATLQLDGQAIAAAVPTRLVRLEIWRWILLAALALLALEWYAYHQRL